MRPPRSELIENPHAELAPFSWDRIVERHGHLAAIREAMLVLEDLPAATRAALVAKLSETLAQFVVARNWLERRPRRAHRRPKRATAPPCNIAARSRGEEMQGLVRAFARHRPAHCGPDPARAAVEQSRAVRLRRSPNSPICRWRASPRCCTTAAAPSLHALLRRAGLPEVDVRARSRSRSMPATSTALSTATTARCGCAGAWSSACSPIARPTAAPPSR